ncbi:hypothetical protein [Pandoraea sputorum]|uniref:hypothetical protein n=1 Tax=Pandoraea sputorum TaxID=93222 RepID=UPI001782D227|nr:hypothetical protein [Pandoraea sputorum]
MLVRLARRLSLTGAEALRRSLDPTAPPNAFATHLTQRDRWYLDGAVWHQDAEACLARGDNAAAAICFKAAAKRFAHVPGKATLVAELHRPAGEAHARSHDRVAAVAEFMTACKRELEHVLVLPALAQPHPSDAAASLDAVTRAACDGAAVAALYRALALPEFAIIVSTIAASAFADLGLWPQAVALLSSIADIWCDIAEVHRQANELALAESADFKARRAYQNAAFAQWAAKDYVAAAHTLVKVPDYEMAAATFRMGGDHGTAGLCYLMAGQRCEAAAVAQRHMGQPAQANVEAQKALAFYGLACHELSQTTEGHVNVPRYAVAAVTAKAHFDALLLWL